MGCRSAVRAGRIGRSVARNRARRHERHASRRRPPLGKRRSRTVARSRFRVSARSVRASSPGSRRRGRQRWSPTPTRSRLEQVAAEHGSRVVALDEIYRRRLRHLLSVRLGLVTHRADDSPAEVRCVVGAANNQLATDADADRLVARGHPVRTRLRRECGRHHQRGRRDRRLRLRRAATAIDNIQITVSDVLEAADEHGINPHRAAVHVAEERIERIGTLHRHRGLRRA